MWERFTERAKHVISAAIEEAKRLGSEYVRTEHILLGLCREPDGIAARALENLGVDIEALAMEIEQQVQRGNAVVSGEEIAFTPRAKKVLELAVEEARRLNHGYIGTEHIILGLVKEGEGIAAKVLQDLKIDLERIQAEVIRVLGDQGKTSPHANSSKKSQTPILDALCKDLTGLAYVGKFEAVVGRDREVEKLAHILCRQFRNNALLIGPVGAGKRAIVHALCHRIVKRDLPVRLLQKRVVELSLASLLGSAKYRGTVEERVKSIAKECRRSENVIIVLDAHAFVSWQHDHEITQAVRSILLEDMSESPLQFIVTLSEESAGTDNSDLRALTAACTILHVQPPDASLLRQILLARRKGLEEYHRVRIAENAIDCAVQLTMTKMLNPVATRVAVELLDASAVQITALPAAGLKELGKQLDEITRQKEQAIRQQEYSLASELRDKERALVLNLEKKQKALDGLPVPELDEEAVWRAFKELTEVTAESIEDLPDGSVVLEHRFVRETTLQPGRPAPNPHEQIRNPISNYERLQTESILQGTEVDIIPGTGFVLLPHKDEFEVLYNEVIAPAMSANSIEPLKANDIYEPGAILSQVWLRIRHSEVIVADASTLNPNVIYELGLCYGLHRCPILLVRDIEELPFNLRSLRYILYKNTVAGAKALRERLTQSIEEFLAASRGSRIGIR